VKCPDWKRENGGGWWVFETTGAASLTPEKVVPECDGHDHRHLLLPKAGIWFGRHEKAEK